MRLGFLFSCSRLRLLAVGSAFAALALAASAALGQKPAAPAYSSTVMQASAADLSNARGYGNVGFSPNIMSVPGKPFTATRIYTEAGRSVQVTIARDSVGRIHYESAAPEGGPIGVIIYDPIAHTLSQYSTTTEGGIADDAQATVTQMGLVSEMTHSAPLSADPASPELGDQATESSSAISGSAPAAVAAAPPRPSGPKLPSPSDLPEQLVNGIAAVGQRSVQKYGDRQQFFMIQEEWFSPEYDINLRQSVWRQNTLDSTVETRDLVAGDPDPDLFRVPGGYSISK